MHWSARTLCSTRAGPIQRPCSRPCISGTNGRARTNMSRRSSGRLSKSSPRSLRPLSSPSTRLIRGLGATGGFSVQIQDPSGGDFKKFSAVAEEFIAKARQDPAIGSIGTNFRVSSPRLYAHVNRERAKTLGVPISDVFDTMQAYFGNFYVNDFLKFGRVYRVQTEADAQYRMSPG